MTDESWREEALCAETDPDSFFPEKGESAQAAKQICRACPVRVDCLTYALGRDEEFGVWAGYTARELKQFRKRKGAA